MWLGRRVGVVVPAYNEERLIVSTLRGIPRFVDHIYVVDDASTDRTVLRAVGVDRRIECLRHRRNRGVGAAIASGYQRAAAAGDEIIVVMAGDNQMDPADLPALLQPIVSGGADYVKGNRFLHPERARMPLGRRLAGRALAIATAWATGYDLDDSQCGYTAISRQAVMKLPLDELWSRYGYPNDLLGLLAAGGFRVVEVAVRPVYAGERSGIRAYHAAVVLAIILRRRLLSMRRARPSQPFRSKSSCVEPLVQIPTPTSPEEPAGVGLSSQPWKVAAKTTILG